MCFIIIEYLNDKEILLIGNLRIIFRHGIRNLSAKLDKFIFLILEKQCLNLPDTEKAI